MDTQGAPIRSRAHRLQPTRCALFHAEVRLSRGSDLRGASGGTGNETTAKIDSEVLLREEAVVLGLPGSGVDPNARGMETLDCGAWEVTSIDVEHLDVTVPRSRVEEDRCRFVLASVGRPDGGRDDQS